MKKILNRKALGYIALALVCVFAGSVLTLSFGATAENNGTTVTSPFTEPVAKVRDSVVGVNNYQLVSNYGNSYGYGNGSFPWSDYFGFGYGYGNGNGRGNGGQQDSSREVKYGSGSGVVIAKGYVLTNYHVVEGSSSLKISVDSDESNLYDATVAASDSTKDVAVLYAPDLPLEPVELGDSDQLQVGDWCFLVGNAIGFTKTVTAGIVSGLDREIESDTVERDRYGRKTQVVNTMIQTDAAINSGNSGGGMFNTAGQLVGIPTLKYSGSRSYNSAMIESIGMCIPINEAKDIINEALNGEKPAAEDGMTGSTPDASRQENKAQNDRTGKPRLGVTVTTLNTNGQVPNGAYIVSVQEGSPAQRAGLQAGDILVELNGEVVSNTTDMMKYLENSQEGDVVTVKVWRPQEVEDAENARISTNGEYVEDIQVSLAILDQIAQ